MKMARILFVDDNEMNRDMLSRRLTRAGHEVVLASDGEEGVARAESDRPELVLMDIGLPGIDGYEATRQIRAGELATVPIIALTAHAMVTDRDRALDAGCDDFDTKPIDFPRLLGKIDALLSRQG
jgi:CheY-like chemotaxis protein